MHRGCGGNWIDCCKSDKRMNFTEYRKSRVNKPKRGMLGSTVVDINDYWTNGKCGQELKCCETNIYAEIDYCQEVLCRTDTREEETEQRHRQDVLWVCLNAIDECKSDDAKLRKAGTIIGNMIKEGHFDVAWVSYDEENAHVDMLVNLLKERITKGEEEEVKNPEFSEWFDEVVVNCNYYSNLDGTKTKDKPRLSGLGSMTDDEYSKQAKDGGPCLLYAVIPDKNKMYDGCKNKKQMMRKISQQAEQVRWLGNCGTNMTSYSVKKNIQAGVCAKAETKSPEEALELLKHGKENGCKGLGFIWFLIPLIIMAVVAIVGLVTKIIDAKRAERMAKIAEIESRPLTKEDLEGAMPDYNSDYGVELMEESMNILNAEMSKMQEDNTSLDEMLATTPDMTLATSTDAESESGGMGKIIAIGAAGVSVLGLIVAVILKKKKKKKEQQ